MRTSKESCARLFFGERADRQDAIPDTKKHRTPSKDSSLKKIFQRSSSRNSNVVYFELPSRDKRTQNQNPEKCRPSLRQSVVPKVLSNEFAKPSPPCSNFNIGAYRTASSFFKGFDRRREEKLQNPQSVSNATSEYFRVNQCDLNRNKQERRRRVSPYHTRRNSCPMKLRSSSGFWRGLRRWPDFFRQREAMLLSPARRLPSHRRLYSRYPSR